MYNKVIRRKPIHREYNEGVKLHQFLKYRDIAHAHVPNETGGNFARGSMNKNLGVSAGFPDYVIFLKPSQTKRGMPLNVAIELKEPSGKNKATPLQKQWLELLQGQGFIVSVCYGFEDAKRFLIDKCGYFDNGVVNLKDFNGKCPF